MLSILLALTAHAGPVPFHPGSGDGTVSIDASGKIRGVPVQLVGTVLVRSDGTTQIEDLPEVGSVRERRNGILELEPVPGVDPTELSESLYGLPGIRWAHPDLRVHLVARSLPDDPLLAEQWHLQNTGQHGYVVGSDINAEEAWEITTGAGQLIAIIDTGIDPTHPDIDSINGWDYVDADPDSTPVGDDPHGTSCAGIAAGIGGNGLGVTGVAYDAQTYSIRIIGQTTLYDMYDAFVEAVDAGAGVLSNSWGFDDGCADIPPYGAIEDAMAYADENGRGGKGSAVVFAAGNGNCDITDDGLQAHPVVTSVAASSGFDVRESYSSFGPWVDIAAPSGRIATTDIVGPLGYNGLGNDYTDTFNGTSASAPEIAGVFALMFAANERLTAKEAREAMCATAVRIDLGDGDWDQDGWSPYYGCGRVDAGAAVRAVANQGPPEVPIPLGPVAEATVDNAFLQWSEPVDPDGDRLTYKVKYSYPDFPEVSERTVDTDLPWLELAREDAEVGWRILWQVRAIDPWGPTEWSEQSEFTVVKAPEPASTSTEPASGCNTAPGAAHPASDAGIRSSGLGAMWLGWLGLAGLAFRRARATGPRPRR